MFLRNTQVFGFLQLEYDVIYELDNSHHSQEYKLILTYKSEVQIHNDYNKHKLPNNYHDKHI